MTLPEGTVTFLRTDIEGSMELARALGAHFDEVNAEHHGLVRAAIGSHAGEIVRTEGDAVFAAFSDAAMAARAAIDVQRTMLGHGWPAGRPVRVRIGIHTGRAFRAGDDYGGFEVSRAARIAAAGWGGQIILSDPTRALIAGEPEADWSIRGLGPHRLKDIPVPEPLFQLEAPGLPSEFPPLRSGVDPASRLPERLSTLIGRELELETLERLFRESRLLTLTGPGGSGKTVLALELARGQAAAFADGAAFVDLQAVRDHRLVRAEIAHGVGLLDGAIGSAAERLADFMGSRESLLVIDNFEQVIDAADVVADLLAASPRSRIVVTSRTALRLRGEQEFAVRPMALDGVGDTSGSDAVRLFIDRARRVRPDLQLDDETVGSIAEVCRRVDGLPLAIELCAALVGTLSPQAILDRLREHRPLPGSGPRDLPDRQRTVEQTVAWSYELLSSPLQELFRHLAVFEESFDLDQAEAVSDPSRDGTDTLDGIVQLAEHSLLVRVEDAVGGIRFGWLETIRQHAMGRLAASGEGEDVRQRHRRAFAVLAREAAPHLPGSAQAFWVDRLAADDANLRTATISALDGADVDTALGLVGSLWRYWLQSGRLSEGRTFAARAMALPGADAESVLRVRALDAAGGLAYWAGDIPQAHLLYEQELELAQRVGDRPGEATALLDLFFTREYRGDIDGAMAAKAAAMEILGELGDSFGLARLQQSGFLITLARGVQDPASVLAEVEAMASDTATMEDAWLSRTAIALRGFACLRRGEIREGLRWLVEALRADLAVRERAEAALGLQFGVLATPQMGRPDVAVVLHGAAQGAFERLGIRPPASYEDLAGVDPIPQLLEALGTEGFAAAVERGRRLSIEEAIDLLEAVADG